MTPTLMFAKHFTKYKTVFEKHSRVNIVNALVVSGTRKKKRLLDY